LHTVFDGESVIARLEDLPLEETLVSVMAFFGMDAAGIWAFA
jgi:hypothetical protein